jgi:hypothetical protein
MRKRNGRTLFYAGWSRGAWFLLASFVSSQVSAGSLDKIKSGENPLCKIVQENVASGDILFTSSDSEVFQKVAKSTLSWTSHVGLALAESDKQIYIYESTLPVSKKTKLCDFVKRTSKEQIAILRPRTKIDSFSLQRLKFKAESLLGRVYHTGFDYDSKTRMYCSKFVYDIYIEALGIEIGYIETFADLIRKNPDPELIKFWDKWFLGKIPEHRRVVTPASQLEDNDLEMIFTTLDNP